MQIAKIRARSPVDIIKITVKLVWRGKRCRITNVVLMEKKEVGDTTLPDFKTDCKATVVETVSHW